MLLDIAHLNKNFGSVTALRDLSFSVSKGEALGIIGPKGSGKSTLLNLITGIHPSQGGDIYFAGRDIKGLPTEKIIQLGIYRTFQVPQPFYGMTVMDNLMIGLMCGGGYRSIKDARGSAMDVLDRVGMGEYAEAKVESLGLAELKRLDLAKGLCLKPLLFIIDEISAGLSREEMDRILGLLLSLKQDGLSMLIAEHVPCSSLDLFDRVIILDFGELVGEGPPDEIAENPRIRKIYANRKGALDHIEKPVEEDYPDTGSQTMLSVREVSTGHGGVNAISGVNLDVFKGDIVALAGINGSGKTSLINAVNRSLPLLEGDIFFKGESIARRKPYEIVELGISQCIEGRRILPGLTVRENLEIGAYSKRARSKWRSTMEKVFEIFPVLTGRRDMKAGILSGGEQQMMAIGCAMMGLPELIIIDELSLGLPPLIIEKLYQAILEINRQGITIFLAEQNLNQIFEVANRAYIIEKGRIIRSGIPRELKKDKYVSEVYFRG